MSDRFDPWFFFGALCFIGGLAMIHPGLILVAFGALFLTVSYQKWDKERS